MSSIVYDITNSLIFSTDLLLSGQLLIEFANAVFKEKNRTTIVNKFYETLFQWGFNEYMLYDLPNNGKRKYFICDEKNAARMYVALSIPGKTSTVKTLNGIKAFGEFILSHYTRPVGECISETSLVDILQYLEKEFLFASKVFSNRKAAFIRIHNSHIECNSQCLTMGNGKEVLNHFFLYHMKRKDSPNPEEVLFHELGHALHARCFGDVSKVPDDIIDMLHDLCFPHLRESNAAEQCELFADVLGLGLAYQTPYEKYYGDSYKIIHQDDKKAFKMLVEKIMKDL